MSPVGMNTPIDLQVPKFDNTIGAYLIGNTIAAILYGITTVQVYIYYTRPSNDSRVFKCLIFVLWLLDTAEQALFSSLLYHYAVKNFANPAALALIPSTISPVAIVCAVSDVCVRSIFVFRLWKFSDGRMRFPVLLIAILTFVSLLAGLALASVCVHFTTLLDITDHASWILYVTFSCGAAADIVIAASMCYTLWAHRTHSPRTNSLLHALMIYSINSGALTSIFAIVSLITFATMPKNFIFLSILLVLPKLLFNAALATLNARRRLKKTYMDTTEPVSIQLSNLAAGNGTPTSSGLRVEKSVVQEIHSDMSHA
ncbi:hypothetical protein BDW22DRAFT_1361266 [Trametopsis cervina]|nr:hypothetical protein BDW22DRAFT_1361266 [Trametopsis cervina]